VKINVPQMEIEMLPEQSPSASLSGPLQAALKRSRTRVRRWSQHKFTFIGCTLRLFREIQPRVVRRAADHFEGEAIRAVGVHLADHRAAVVVIEYERGAGQVVLSVE
jgi:hypothetical protein